MCVHEQAGTFPPPPGPSLPCRLTEPQQPGRGGERRRRQQRVPVQRSVTLPYSLWGGGGGRALCTFSSRAFPHFNKPGPIASRREQRDGGRKAHPGSGRIRNPPGRQSPEAPGDSSAAPDWAPGYAAVFLLLSSSSSFSSSVPSLKGERRPAKGEKLGSVCGVSGGPRDQDEK